MVNHVIKKVDYQLLSIAESFNAYILLLSSDHPPDRSLCPSSKKRMPPPLRYPDEDPSAVVQAVIIRLVMRSHDRRASDCQPSVLNLMSVIQKADGCRRCFGNLSEVVRVVIIRLVMYMRSRCATHHLRRSKCPPSRKRIPSPLKVVRRTSAEA